MRLRVGGTSFGAALLLALVVSATASAHVVKQFGTYSVAMGWLHEPTYVGVENSVQVIVKDSAGKPVNDLQPGDLQVVVSTAGQQTAALPLQPSFDPDTGLGTPGEYTASLIPTQVGDYTFHLSGSIHGQAVDETATSSDQTFDSVTAGTDVQFPVKLPAMGDLSTLIQRVDGRAPKTAATQAQQAASRRSAARRRSRRPARPPTMRTAPCSPASSSAGSACCSDSPAWSSACAPRDGGRSRCAGRSSRLVAALVLLGARGRRRERARAPAVRRPGSQLGGQDRAAVVHAHVHRSTGPEALVGPGARQQRRRRWRPGPSTAVPGHSDELSIAIEAAAGRRLHGGVADRVGGRRPHRSGLVRLLGGHGATAGWFGWSRAAVLRAALGGVRSGSWSPAGSSIVGLLGLLGAAFLGAVLLPARVAACPCDWRSASWSSPSWDAAADGRSRSPTPAHRWPICRARASATTQSFGWRRSCCGGSPRCLASRRSQATSGAVLLAATGVLAAVALLVEAT